MISLLDFCRQGQAGSEKIQGTSGDTAKDNNVPWVEADPAKVQVGIDAYSLQIGTHNTCRINQK